MMRPSLAVDDDPIATILIFRLRFSASFKCESGYLKLTRSGCVLQGRDASGMSASSPGINSCMPVLDAEIRRIANEILLTLVCAPFSLTCGGLSWTEKSLS